MQRPAPPPHLQFFSIYLTLCDHADALVLYISRLITYMGAPLRRLAEGCSSFTIDLLPFPAPLSNAHLVLPNQLRVEPGFLLGGVVGRVRHPFRSQKSVCSQITLDAPCRCRAMSITALTAVVRFVSGGTVSLRAFRTANGCSCSRGHIAHVSLLTFHSAARASRSPRLSGIPSRRTVHHAMSAVVILSVTFVPVGQQATERD